MFELYRLENDKEIFVACYDTLTQAQIAKRALELSYKHVYYIKYLSIKWNG